MRRVVVVPYDPAWPARFKAQTAVLHTILGDEIVAVHHVGSTAVPGLQAKPIIDILVEVRDIERLDRYNAALIAQGYLPRGEYGLPGRRYFPRDVGGARVAHVHCWQTGHPEIARHLAFVAYLRAHPQEAAAYGALKAQLAQQFADAREDYVAGKHEFIVAMQQRALVWWKERP